MTAAVIGDELTKIRFIAIQARGSLHRVGRESKGIDRNAKWDSQEQPDQHFFCKAHKIVLHGLILLEIDWLHNLSLPGTGSSW